MAKILVINPGSTSTKIGIFEDETLIVEEKVMHTAEELKGFSRVADQFDYRLQLLQDLFARNDIDVREFACVVGRGGLMKPIISGTYTVRESMLDDFKNATYGEHASNLGAMLAYAIADGRVPAFIVDPVVVDELQEIARVSGQSGIDRISIFHALNQKAVAKRYAQEIGKDYTDLNLIVAHLGGGVSVGAHRRGSVIDVNNALDGDGPFSPERAGGLPVRSVIHECFHSGMTEKELRKHYVGCGGLVSYFGTSDAREVRKMGAEGDEKADLVYRAMAYQTAKEIGACAAVLHGVVDAILLTGGIAYDNAFTEWVAESVSWIAKVFMYPGEDELEALALGGLRILRGEEQAREYA